MSHRQRSSPSRRTPRPDPFRTLRGSHSRQTLRLPWHLWGRDHSLSCTWAPYLSPHSSGEGPPFHSEVNSCTYPGYVGLSLIFFYELNGIIRQTHDSQLRIYPEAGRENARITHKQVIISEYF